MKRRKGAGADGRIAAWAIHALTAAGAVLALLALAAVESGRAREALVWLLAALVIDGVDGTLARHARVSERLPRIDGPALDLVVDYLTYVFVPAWFLWRLGAFPPPVALPLTALILLSALYTFARRDMKTSDGYFRGFPALWNVVALYLYVAAPPPWLAAAVAIVLIVMTFAPVHVVHPFRVRDFGMGPPAAASIWGLATLSLLLPLDDRSRDVALGVSLAAAAVLVAMGLVRTVRGAREDG
ncbi:MAG TPA: CDP-alcohol phosphatidyltransferase family protein [Sphingomicrobium sp.]|nr:CDP-alcohol phosphatidyltransferase family protein [Sphingomicrobium sp.]